MKKLFIIVAILFAVNVKAQDTTYTIRGSRMYQIVRTEVNLSNADSNLKYKAIKLKQKRQWRRMNRIAFAGFVLFNILVWRR